MGTGSATVVHMDNTGHLQNRTTESFTTTANRLTKGTDVQVARLEMEVAALEQRIKELLDENFTLRREITERGEKKAKR